MKKITLIAALALAILFPQIWPAAALAAGKGTPEDPIVWRMGGLYARGIAYGKTYEAFAENV